MHNLDVLYALDAPLRRELAARVDATCPLDQALLRLAIDGLEQISVEDRCSLYELMDATRHSLLEMHGLDLCEWRREADACGWDDLLRVTGEPGTAMSLLWNLDVALGMVEMFFAHGSPAMAALTKEVQRATNEAWDRYHVDEALMDCGLDRPTFAEA